MCSQYKNVLMGYLHSFFSYQVSGVQCVRGPLSLDSPHPCSVTIWPVATLLCRAGLMPLFRVWVFVFSTSAPFTRLRENRKRYSYWANSASSVYWAQGSGLGEGSEPGGGGLGCLSLCQAWRVRQRRPQTDTQGSSRFREAAFAWFWHLFECWSQEVVTPHVYNVK